MNVVLADLDDLHLGQQQLGQRNRRRIRLQSSAQGDDVAEVQFVVEDVDMEAVRGVVEDCPAALGHDEDRAILDIP